MKKIIGKVSLVVCVVCLVSLPGAWAAQKLNTKTAPAQSPTQGLTSGVVRVAPGSLTHSAPAGTLSRAPAPLPAKKKAELINDIRAQSGKKPLQVPPAVNEVVLTPSQPSSGNSWLGCQEGNLCAAPPHGSIDLDHWNGRIEMEFNLPLITGSFYLVDCTVQAYGLNYVALENMEWHLHGAQESIIFDEDGHLCFAFRATGASAHFAINPRCRGGRLYRVELTRVP